MNPEHKPLEAAELAQLREELAQLPSQYGIKAKRLLATLDAERAELLELVEQIEVLYALGVAAHHPRLGTRHSDDAVKIIANARQIIEKVKGGRP